MPRRGLKRGRTGAAVVEQPLEPLPDLTRIEPDSLRDKVHKALSTLPQENQALMRERLLAGLRKAGVHVGPCLLILGVPAKTADELTSLEIAKLVRYIRMNHPEAIRAVADTLAELLTSSRKSQEAVKRVA
jgi:hypothetical protein